MASTRPEPTALKLLKGNPGKRPLNQREPKPKEGFPSPPRWLNGAARTEWFRVKDAMEETGAITKADRAMLLAYCLYYAKFEERAKLGETLSPPDMLRMQSLAAEFGLTPSGRSRIVVGKKDDANRDEKKAFFS